MNIGCRPTLNSNNKISIECHLFDWTKNIYNKILHVEVIERIRGEEKFKDLNNLKKQIKKDIEVAKKILDGTST